MHESAKPIHEHDCPDCEYYGVFVHASTSAIVSGYVKRSDLHDLYYCPTQKTYIARYGELGDYISGNEASACAYPTDHPMYHVWRMHTGYNP